MFWVDGENRAHWGTALTSHRNQTQGFIVARWDKLPSQKLSTYWWNRSRFTTRFCFQSIPTLILQWLIHTRQNDIPRQSYLSPILVKDCRLGPNRNGKRGTALPWWPINTFIMLVQCSTFMFFVCVLVMPGLVHRDMQRSCGGDAGVTFSDGSSKSKSLLQSMVRS